MSFGPVTYLLGYVAGVLSTLSPCVLPLIPILVATAGAQHRLGPLALASGLALSFAGVGLFIATLGISIGLDQGLLRQIAALIMIGFAAVLLSTSLQAVFVRATSSLGASGNTLLAGVKGDGLGGQFLIGLLLGVAWSPCVGPTLGAATTLAAQGNQLRQVALLMLLFGLGAGTPLVVLGGASREATRWLKGRLAGAGSTGKWFLGVALAVIGVSILTGFDRELEVLAVDVSPTWLTSLTTRF